jgi:hypothetical protein
MTGLTIRRHYLCAGLLLALLFWGVRDCRAQIPAADRPDVQVVVMPYPTGTWGVSLVYPHKVPRAQADQQFKQLLALGGWKSSADEWEERGLERNSELMQSPDAKGIEAEPVMSSLTFQTTGNIVDVADGTMSLEPFARAFRDLKRIHVTYLLPATFKFRGVRDFHDENVDVAALGQQGAWTYVVNIKNHQLSALHLPRYEIVRSGAQFQQAKAAAEKAVRLRRMVGTGAVVLLALATGMFVWLWTRR